MIKRWGSYKCIKDNFKKNHGMNMFTFIQVAGYQNYSLAV